MRTPNEVTFLAKETSMAESIWPQLTPGQKERLVPLLARHGLSVASGDVRLIDGNWYVTNSGLLHVARRNRCGGIQTEVASALSDPPSSRWVVKASVFRTPRSKGFVGYGDADPSNVSPLLRGAELRIAETRAVNRALRKAYGIGICSVEELGAGQNRPGPLSILKDNGNGQPRLRDRLLLLIRQHHLNPRQVKRYAAQFCSTSSLREASREQVEGFVNHLATLAAENREKLLTELSACSDEAAAPGEQPSSSGGDGRPRRDRKRPSNEGNENKEAA